MNIKIQIIAQKILEIMENSNMTEEQFFDRCLREPVDTPVGIKHPDTNEICLGFCNHRNDGLMFYLPEDLEFNEDQLNQTHQNLSKSEVRRQTLLEKPQKKHHPDSP